ncbi:MAG: ATP-dependent DNA ligase [Actinomycetota bacterium]|nr:ATP-dependent DNA ligase [Actinomycetota bacterium]
MGTRIAIEVGGRELEVSSLDRILWPNVGFTKGDALRYYADIAPTMVERIAGRPLTLKRAPHGIAGEWWYQTECPHAPGWIRTVPVPNARGDKTWQQCVVDEPAAIVWLANLGCLEFHPLMTRGTDLDRPVELVFDLDPGVQTGLLGAAHVALALRGRLTDRGIDCAVKSSGMMGLHVTVDLDGTTTFAESKALAGEVAAEVASDSDVPVTTSRHAARDDAVLIDVAQNGRYRSVVAPFSLRLNALPLVAAPLAWTEVDRAVTARDAASLLITPEDALARSRALQ